MVKPTIKWGKGTTALLPRKSSWNPVDASTGKTNPTTQGVAIGKKSLVTCCQSLSTHNTVPKSIKTHSSSVKSMAAASKVGSQSGDGEAPVAGQRSCSRKISKSKVVGHKSLGSTLRFPLPISRKMGGGTRLRQQQDAPSGNQYIFCNRTHQLPFICWAALPLGTVEKLLQNWCRKSGSSCDH